ncbi:MAG TPA: RNA polymerase sigma factor [Candidatus Flavonifractor merdigallinarum]|uniref:RNA polymerase sigma factor n=1 Tax=Candidatus Flavonifractor merdigallinarum TaxID=2838589 RepID=A0A9D1Y6G4_9FIRM|nr:RNA polymerase sigma factor [Candidatus Flavonifractor merdigallinarum]
MQLQKENKPISDAEFLTLIEDKSDSFYRVAYGYVRNSEDAKDIVQETVCKAYVAKGRLNDPNKFYPWFYRILANTAISYLRKHSRTVAWDEEILERAVLEEENWGDSLWIRESLKRLEAKSRTVIILKIYENMTFAEIAQILKKPENSVKSLYYRGLKLLKERMQVNG